MKKAFREGTNLESNPIVVLSHFLSEGRDVDPVAKREVSNYSKSAVTRHDLVGVRKSGP